MIRTAPLVLVAMLVGGLSVGVASSVVAAPVSVSPADGIWYSADDENIAAGATVVGTRSASRDVVIPASAVIDGISYAVTAIGVGAFADGGLTAVTLPEGVTAIGSYAFDGNDLAAVTLPDGVTTIGTEAFSRNVLTAVTIPGSVTSIGAGAFRFNSLQSVVMAGPVPTLGAGSFGGDPVVTYPWRFDAAQVAGGYTSPTWEGLTSQARATVAFDTAGGGAAPALQGVVVGQALADPAAPTREGFTFEGWYTSATGGTAWDFGDALTGEVLIAADSGGPSADLVLVARWTAVELAATGAGLDGLTGIAAAVLLAGGIALLVRPRSRAAAVRT